MLSTPASQALRLLAALPLYAVGFGLAALSVLVATLGYVAAVARFLFVAVGVALLVAGVSFERTLVVVLAGGVLVAVGLWVIRVRATLHHGLRTEPAAMVARTRLPETDTERAVVTAVERLCQAVGQPTPAVRVRDADQPVCYTVRYPVETPPIELLERDVDAYRAVRRELRFESAAYDAAQSVPEARVLVVSTGLLSALSDGELRAVLAHEVTHLRDRDLTLMNWLLLPVFWGADLAAPERGLLSTLTGVGVVAVTMAGVAASTRGREYLADAAAAELTGDPAALASALERLSGDDSDPDVDLRSVTVLNVVATTGTGGALVDLTDPSTADRVERLRSMVASTA